MAKNDLTERTKNFSHRCVKLAISLPSTLLGKYLAGQLIRSSISTSANYRAACVAQSKKAFIAKLSISLEEVDESNFWITFIEDECLLNKEQLQELKKESKELTLILAASRLTARKSLRSKKPNASAS